MITFIPAANILRSLVQYRELTTILLSLISIPASERTGKEQRIIWKYFVILICPTVLHARTYGIVIVVDK